MTIHLLRMAAGITELSELHAYIQKAIRTEKGLGPVTSIHTRNTPRKTADLLEGGSVYNIMRSRILCRRRILDIRAVKDRDGTDYCEILLDPALIRVMPVAHKPFQGWRYLEDVRKPADLGLYRPDGEGESPSPELAAELRALGLL